jgi:phosphoribosylformylglycinamidine synthase subunit PurL
MHAVAEAARKVACTGATPVAATNCLNFGNPEKPEIMAQLSAAIDGIAEACTALGTPVTGGNVSLYNETKGEGIYPTPVIGIVGLLDDVSKAVPNGFQRVGDTILLLYSLEGDNTGSSERTLREAGSSAYGQTILGSSWGMPPYLNLQEEAAFQRCLLAVALTGQVSSISDVLRGGLAVALAKTACLSRIGLRVGWGSRDEKWAPIALFGESGSMALISCPAEAVENVKTVVRAEHTGIIAHVIGETIADRVIISSEHSILGKSKKWIDTTIEDISRSYSGVLESQLAAEVVTA